MRKELLTGHMNIATMPHRIIDTTNAIPNESPTSPTTEATWCLRKVSARQSIPPVALLPLNVDRMATEHDSTLQKK